MENQNPSKNSNASEWTTVKTAKAKQQKQLEFDKMKNRLSELEEIVANLQMEKTKNVAKIDQLTSVNAEVNAKVCKFDEELQKLKAENQQMQDQLSKMPETSALPTSIPLVRFYDVFDRGAFDYKRLDGKVLFVDKLVQSYDGEWFVERHNKILFEHQNFKVLPVIELIIRTDFDTVFNHVIINRTRYLCFLESKIAFANVKRLIALCDNIKRVTFERSTVKDANGAIMEIDQIFKEVLEVNSYIKHIEYYFKNGELTTETLKKLVQLPPFPNTRKFWFYNIHQGFDLLLFGEFIKKNPKVYYKLHFSGSEEFYIGIKNAEKDFRQTLPATCEINLYREDGSYL